MRTRGPGAHGIIAVRTAMFHGLAAADAPSARWERKRLKSLTPGRNAGHGRSCRAHTPARWERKCRNRLTPGRGGGHRGRLRAAGRFLPVTSDQATGTIPGRENAFPPYRVLSIGKRRGCYCRCLCGRRWTRKRKWSHHRNSSGKNLNNCCRYAHLS